MFARWGRFVFRRRWMVLAVTLLMLPVSIILLGFGGQFSEGQTGTATESLKAYSLMDRELPASNPGFALMFSSATLHPRDPAFRTAMLQALAPLRSDPRVTSIFTPYSGGSQTVRLLSRDGHRALAEIEFKRTVPNYDDAFVSLRDEVHSRRLQVLATGNLALNKGFSDATKSDLTRAEVVSLPLALILLLLLAILGPRINRLRVPFIHPDRAGSDRGFWYSISRAVMAHPWRVLLPTSALLIAVGLPAAHLRLAGGDYTALPKNAEARHGFELLIKQFPGGNTNVIPVVVDFAHGSPLTSTHVSQLYDLAHWLLRQGNVSRVESVVTLDPTLSRASVIRMAAGPRSALCLGEQGATQDATAPSGAAQ